MEYSLVVVIDGVDVKLSIETFGHQGLSEAEAAAEKITEKLGGDYYNLYAQEELCNN